MTPIAKTQLSLAAVLLLGLASTGCQASAGQQSNHWNIESIGPRLAYHGLGYRSDLSESYRDHQWQNKQDINLTLRRHFLNHNPNNPFQADDPSLTAPRPPHSILPDPVDYFHLESLLVGAIMDGATGTFIPLPIGSILGTIEPGGPEEFLDGMSSTLTGSFGGRIEQPPSNDEFRVRNK
jgi:hypothetical protein